jgi:ketosteroid isomerase-like protein
VPREEVEVVQQVIAEWNRGDVDAFVSVFDPACEVVFRPDVPEPGPFHGRDELRVWAEGFRSAWDYHHAELTEATAIGEHVFAEIRATGRGSESSIDIDDLWAFVFTIRGGKVAVWRGFVSRDEARAAAGVD